MNVFFDLFINKPKLLALFFFEEFIFRLNFELSERKNCIVDVFMLLLSEIIIKNKLPFE